jgi:hypothetical protein
MIRFSLSVMTAFLLFTFFVHPSHAQATRTWVSGVGDDVNPCSRTAPCKTFAGAFSKTASGGEINCLDSGGFGALTLTRAMTVSCESLEAGVLVAGTNGIIVSAGVNDAVVLRGLDFIGVGTGLAGIRFNSGASLHVENCTIRGFGGNPGVGILFAPSGASDLSVRNVVITDNNKAATSAGILIQPTGSGAARAIVENSMMVDNGNGMIVDGSLSSASQIYALMRTSSATHNAHDGVRSSTLSGKAPTRVVVSHSSSTSNATGLNATGNGADLTVAYSEISDNATGVSFTAPAQLRTYSTNQLRGNNVTNGTFSSTVPLE